MDEQTVPTSIPEVEAVSRPLVLPCLNVLY